MAFFPDNRMTANALTPGGVARATIVDSGADMMLEAGYWMLDAGCWILDAGYWILDARSYWILDS
jgi:hypothetical protein